MTTARALAARRPALRLPKVDTRLVVGLLLVALSVLGGLRLASTADDTVAVYAATRDLPADHVLTRDDVRVTRIGASDSVLDGLLPARLAPPVGRTLRFPIAEGGLLADAAVAGKGATANGREITVPIGADHALGGALAPGDRVDVLGSFDKGTELAKTLTVAKGAQVVDVVSSDGLFGQREGELSALTLSVKPDDVVLVAFAVRNGEVDVVRAAPAGKSVRSRFDVSELP
jgi:Flp pilus assembly protein CpaB